MNAQAVSVETFRDAVRQAVAQSSTRRVAADIGEVSPAWVRYFLRRGTPYSRTLRRLRLWYVRWARDQATVQPEVAEAALLTLLELVPVEARGFARVAVVSVLWGICDKHRAHSPAILHLRASVWKGDTNGPSREAESVEAGGVKGGGGVIALHLSLSL